MLSQSFLFKLSTLNIIVIASTILLSGLAIYNTACVLMVSVGDLNNAEQKQFNALLFDYLLVFVSLTIIIGSILHYFLTKKLISPVQKLIKSTKQMQKGEYPEPIHTNAQGEISVLTEHFNSLIEQLKLNDTERHQLVSNLSHELRTPLTNLNGYLKALRDGLIEGDAELYEALLNESKRIMEMTEQIESLKEWGELSSHPYTSFEKKNIADLIKQCVHMFQFQLERKNIPLNLEVENCTLSLNTEGIQQVMTNLIDNALNYYEGTAPIDIKGSIQDNFYYITIKNPGLLIPGEEQVRIFERLYRLETSRNRETGGSGLGLAIAKEIVEHHQGEISVSSEEGINTFYITLPIQ